MPRKCVDVAVMQRVALVALPFLCKKDVVVAARIADVPMQHLSVAVFANVLLRRVVTLLLVPVVRLLQDVVAVILAALAVHL